MVLLLRFLLDCIVVVFNLDRDGHRCTTPLALLCRFQKHVVAGWQKKKKYHPLVGTVLAFLSEREVPQ